MNIAQLSNPLSVVCFSGPRPTNLPDGGDKKSTAIVEIGRRLKQAVRAVILDGKTVFLNGAMSGFDIIAGETILSLKQDYPELICGTIAPFRTNYFNNNNWTPEWKRRALYLYQNSDIKLTLSETYHKRVYYERNQYMVDHSSVLICYYKSAGRGTKYTLDYATKKQLTICNIAESGKLLLP